MKQIESVEKIALLANGAIEDYDAMLPAIKGYDQYIAVDGGLNHCPALGISPTFLIGDMDSVNPEIREKYPQIKELKVPRDKDVTDLEIAIDFFIKKEVKSITVFGGIGNRLDHSLANVILLSRYPGKVFFETATEIIGVINKQLELSTQMGQVISLIPINGPVFGISTEGLKWKLKEATLDKNFIGISNEALGHSIFVSVKTGDLLYSIQKPSPSSK